MVHPSTCSPWRSATARACASASFAIPINTIIRRIRSVGGSERAADNIKCLRVILKSIKGERDILRWPDFGCGDLNTEHVGFPLRLAHYQDVARIAGIGHDRQSAEVGDKFAQESKSFANGVGRLERQAGDVAARLRQTCDIAARNRVERRGKDDRDSRRRLLYRGD